MAFTPLSPSAHAHLRFDPARRHDLTSAPHQVELLIDDIWPMACRRPVVFVQAAEGAQTVTRTMAVLARPDGQQNAQRPLGSAHLPALLRAYPFSLQQAEGGFRVLVDDSAPALQTQRGLPLFDADGRHSPSLSKILALMRVLSERLKTSRQFAHTLAQMGLLQAIGPEDAAARYCSVDEQALTKLSDSQAVVLRRRQWLALAHAQVLSLARDLNSAEPLFWASTPHGP